MAAIASPKGSTKPKRASKTKKYIFPPASAEETRKDMGITKKDILVVEKVLRRLGYLPKETGPDRPQSKKSGSTKKR
jgi:hypothetical protein